MADSKPAQRSASRTVVMVAVVLLIAVAIAGIVLAGRRNPAPLPGTAAALPDAPGVSTSQADGGTTPVASEVVFEPASDKLPAQANDAIAKFGESARGRGTVRIWARYLTGVNKARDLELAKSRTAAIRHALESNGVKAQSLQIELTEMPAGVLTEQDANRVELSLR